MSEMEYVFKKEGMRSEESPLGRFPSFFTQNALLIAPEVSVIFFPVTRRTDA